MSKKKSPYPKSFAKRLTWRIMLRMLIIMGIASYCLFWVGYWTAFGGSAIICNQIMIGADAEVRRMSSDAYVASVNTAPVIEESLDDPDRMYGLMERMLKTNIRLRSCGVSFIENYYPEKGRWFCPYAVRKDSTECEVRNFGSEKNDYLHAEWFQEALALDSGYWSKPFFVASDGNKPLVSYLIPIHDKQQRTVAIFGVDMALDEMTRKIKFNPFHRSNPTDQWSAKNEAYFFLFNSDGTILSHPDEQRIGRQNFFDHVNEDPDSVCLEMKARQEEDGEMVIDQEDVQVFFKPVKYTDWMIGMVTPMIYFDFVGYFLGGILLIIMGIGLLTVYLSSRRTIRQASKPIRLLALSADEVAKGNFTNKLPEQNSHDEIHQLRDSFEQMQYSLTRYIEELKETTTQKASIESELKIAQDIQMSMLPKTFPPYPERNDIDIFGQQTPAKAVGGDLFDFFIHDNLLYFCIGDVSGKGIPASMLMAVTRSLFRNIAAHESEPNRIVMAINDSLVESNETNMFVTLFMGVLDLQTGRLRYCNAGHIAPLLINQGVSTLPCDPNLPLGVISDWQFTVQETTLTSQTTIFLYTDGLNEAENVYHDQLGDQRVIDLATNLSKQGISQPINLIQAMTETVHSFVGTAEQSDDLTMLAIQYFNVL